MIPFSYEVRSRYRTKATDPPNDEHRSPLEVRLGILDQGGQKSWSFMHCNVQCKGWAIVIIIDVLNMLYDVY